MNVTRDVVNDLLPLYLAGEASADTRSLLEEYLERNPEFARDVREHAARSAALLSPAATELPPDHEKSTFERTRRFNRYRSHLMGFCIGYTIMPFAFLYDDHRLRWLMLRDNPQQAIMFWIAALGCWIAYYVMGRRLRRGV